MRQTSSQLLSASQEESGFGFLFSKPTPPVRKNKNSSLSRSPRALQTQGHSIKYEIGNQLLIYKMKFVYIINFKSSILDFP